MSTFAKEDLIITDTPATFNKNILNKKPLQHAAQAYFVVEGARIRMSSVPGEPATQNSGIPAEIGQHVEITLEQDIENFTAVVIEPTTQAYISVQFSTYEP